MIGLTLEGGGTRGSYQIGAYYALKKCHIKINGVSGTSIGSFNAAMIASHQEKELLEFWQDSNMANLLNLEGFKDIKLKTLNKTFANIKDILANRGISTSKMKDKLDELIDLKKLYKSKMDFGLVTVKLNKLTPVYKYKSEIPKSKLSDYIIASCCLPVFKMEKMIDDNYYVDGGFYDNSPVNLWINKGYSKIYCIVLNGPGFKAKHDKNANIVYIKPSRRLGSILSLQQDKISDNIRLGYFDTLKVIKNLDGNKYIFKKRKDWYYNFLNRKVDPKTLQKVQKFFKTKDNKKLIIKSLEFVMNIEDWTYYEIYNPYKVIKTIKKSNKKIGLIYKYINQIKLF